MCCLTPSTPAQRQPDLTALTDGHLHVILVGTGSPLADATRAAPNARASARPNTPRRSKSPHSPQIEAAFTRGGADVFKGQVVISKDGPRFDLSVKTQGAPQWNF
ncbi:MAG: hypothetical protein HYR56_08370 [Acidobacteria bacterium]|nr:hypothetical protein [Acidobacteriota bacterium]MBI3428400.1 hypothetical protein [Acidobacteriota bacterium]